MRMFPHLIPIVLLGVTTPDVAISAQKHLGTRIAFTKLRESDLGDFRLDAEIWIMNGDGSQATRLTHNSTDDLGATWSPDAKTIAFYGTQYGPDGRGGLAAIPPPYVFLIDVAIGVQTILAAGRFPSWSPDGHRIAFDSGGPASKLFVIDVDGTGVEQIANQPLSRNIRPDWSPNGRQIAFASGPNGNETIYLMNADGSDLTPLTSGNAPDWSPNGRQILFQSTRDGNSEIYVIDADGSNQRRLTFYAGPDLDADWSPDGRTIAFERERSGPLDATLQQVFVLDVYARDAEPMQLTSPPSENGHPAWAGGRAAKP
jgi:Tol biopolymer transport system component